MKLKHMKIAGTASCEDMTNLFVEFNIDAAIAARIQKIANFVKEQDLVKASFWCNVQWIGEGDEEIRTDVDQFVIYNETFIIYSAVKFSETSLKSNAIQLSDIVEEFGLSETVALPSATAQSFLICSSSESTQGEPFAYWSNQWGWGDRKGATVFSRAETQTITLPVSLKNDAAFEAYDEADPTDLPAVQAAPVDFSNLSEMVMDFVEDQLSNNDVASDAEMAASFKESGLTDEQVQAAMAHRTFYMCNMVHIETSPLRGAKNVMVFKPTPLKDFMPVKG